MEAWVLEISIRDCAGNPNNCGRRWSKLSAIDVTEKAIYERLALVHSRTALICALCRHSLCAHIATAHPGAISRFPCLF